MWAASFTAASLPAFSCSQNSQSTARMASDQLPRRIIKVSLWKAGIALLTRDCPSDTWFYLNCRRHSA